jgi:hypothetical protein
VWVTDQGARYTNVKGGKYTKQLLGHADFLAGCRNSHVSEAKI